jgi:hypothetical protein
MPSELAIGQGIHSPAASEAACLSTSRPCVCVIACRLTQACDELAGLHLSVRVASELLSSLHLHGRTRIRAMRAWRDRINLCPHSGSWRSTLVQKCLSA